MKPSSSSDKPRPEVTRRQLAFAIFALAMTGAFVILVWVLPALNATGH